MCLKTSTLWMLLGDMKKMSVMVKKYSFVHVYTIDLRREAYC